MFLNPFERILFSIKHIYRTQIPKVDPVQRQAHVVAFLPNQFPDGSVSKRHRLVPYRG